MSWWSFRPYVSVAQRQAKAAREIKKLQKKGQTVAPVHVEGRTIARTFWGKAWCDNLESYSDFANRMPRGRSYVRNGSVCDLQIESGRVTAMVCGSELYRIKIGIKPLSPRSWAAVKQQCVGQISSVIELLKGKLSRSVMEMTTRRDGGLFPKPGEIELDCSCPDWADMCKHVAAALYGVGARLDERPELLFVLRKVDHLELIEQAGDVGALTGGGAGHKTIAADELSDVFGIELEAPGEADRPAGVGKAGHNPARSRGEVTAPKQRRKPASRPEPPVRGEVRRSSKRGAPAEAQGAARRSPKPPPRRSSPVRGANPA